MADFQNDNDVAKAARVNANRDVVTSPNLWKWAVEGKIFHAGFGAEDADGEENASGTALDDLKPTFVLVAPQATTPLVIPILFRMFMHDDGGGISDIFVTTTLSAGLCATTLAVSSVTAFTFKQSIYSTNPRQSAPQATAGYGDSATASALTNVDYVTVYYAKSMDASLTTGLPTMNGGSVMEIPLLGVGAPIILTSGAAMLVYFVTGTSDALASCYMQWAEVNEDDLK